MVLAVGTAVVIVVSGGAAAIPGIGATATATATAAATATTTTTVAALPSTLIIGGDVIVTASLFSGPLGILALGTSLNSDGSGVTYDCWKPVLHETSEEPSNGMLMKDVVNHPHIAKVTMNEGLVPELPRIVLENIWNESFEIDYVLIVGTGEVACHARPLNVKSD